MNLKRSFTAPHRGRMLRRKLGITSTPVIIALLFSFCWVICVFFCNPPITQLVPFYHIISLIFLDGHLILPCGLLIQTLVDMMPVRKPIVEAYSESPQHEMDPLTLSVVQRLRQVNHQFAAGVSRAFALGLIRCTIQSSRLATLKCTMLRSADIWRVRSTVAWDCDLDVLSTFSALTELNISQYYTSDLTPLAGLHRLHTLKISFTNRAKITSFPDLPALRSLALKSLYEFKLPVALGSLTSLSISQNRLENFDFFTHLPALTTLDMSYSAELRVVPPLPLSIIHLDLKNCPVLADISFLGRMSLITKLSLISCWELVDISSLFNLRRISKLVLPPFGTRNGELREALNLPHEYIDIFEK